MRSKRSAIRVASRTVLVLVLMAPLACKGLKVSGTGNIGDVFRAAKGGYQIYQGLGKMKDLKTEDEISIGRAVSARVLKRHSMTKDEWQGRYVNLVGKLVASHRKRGKLDIFHFAVMDTGKINAYSTPGGYVFVSEGLLDLCRDESELAGVIAHEIAHVEHEHVLQAIETHRQQEGFSQILSGAANVGTAMSDMDNGSEAAQQFLAAASGVASNVLFKKGFPPEQELEADKMAALLTAESGYDPNGLIRILKRIRKQEDNQSGKTHPATADRIQAIKNFIQEKDLPGRGRRLKQRFERNLQL